MIIISYVVNVHSLCLLVIFCWYLIIEKWFTNEENHRLEWSFARIRSRQPFTLPSPRTRSFTCDDAKWSAHLRITSVLSRAGSVACQSNQSQACQSNQTQVCLAYNYVFSHFPTSMQIRDLKTRTNECSTCFSKVWLSIMITNWMFSSLKTPHTAAAWDGTLKLALSVEFRVVLTLVQFLGFIPPPPHPAGQSLPSRAKRPCATARTPGGSDTRPNPCRSDTATARPLVTNTTTNVTPSGEQHRNQRHDRRG